MLTIDTFRDEFNKLTSLIFKEDERIKEVFINLLTMKKGYLNEIEIYVYEDYKTKSIEKLINDFNEKFLLFEDLPDELLKSIGTIEKLIDIPIDPFDECDSELSSIQSFKVIR